MCGDVGLGAMAEVDTIVKSVTQCLNEMQWNAWTKFKYSYNFQNLQIKL